MRIAEEREQSLDAVAAPEQVWVGKPWYAHSGLLTFGVMVLAVALGFAALVVPWQAFLGLGLAALVLAAVVRSTYLGLLVAVWWMYIRPDEFVPGLSRLHMQKLLVLIILVALFMRRSERMPVFKPVAPQTWAILGILGAAALSVVFAVWKGGAFSILDRLVRYSVYYFVAVMLLKTEGRVCGYIWTVVFASALLAFSAIHNYHTGDVVVSGELQRATGANVLFQDPNDLAAAMAMGLPMAYFSIWAARSRSGKLFAAIAVAAMLFGIVFTGSRSGALSVAALFLFTLFVTPRRSLMALVGIVALAVLWFSASPEYKERILSIKQVVSGQSEDPSATIRRMAWDAGRRMFFEHPFIGVGAGNFPNVWATEYTDPGEKPLWKNAHSLYYQLASEQGVVGIAVWGYLVLSIFWSNRKTRKLLCALESRSSPLYFLSYSVDLALLSVLVSGVFVSILYYPFMFTLAAIAAAMDRVVRASVGETGDTSACAVSVVS
jgi:probable O-glycosylation ligase (exosortase A-associated)